MRLLVAWLIAIAGVGASAAPAAAQTVWNVKVSTPDGTTQLRTLETNPDVALPACRCVAGRWRFAAETATHFTGTLDELSFNHARKATRSIRAKIRKTRPLMGVHRDYRAALHGILRGTGPLVLREVAGGQWEVAAYADAPLGDVFASGKWHSAEKRPAKPTPIVDNKSDADALAKLLNDYRAQHGLPRLPLSSKLTKVARAHARDLAVHKPHGGSCNSHSWSKHGRWSACCYDNSRAAARCMWKKPKEVAGYKANGYEIVATASGITPERALELWRKSPSHDAMMTNTGQWKAPWRAMGVAVEGDHAVAWFGELADR